MNMIALQAGNHLGYEVRDITLLLLLLFTILHIQRETTSYVSVSPY